MITAHLSTGPPPPIEEVAFSFEGHFVKLHVQRNDLIHPLVSGNKWRKLAAFVQPQAVGYLSFGGAWSNHLLAVAAMGKMLQQKTVGWIRGEEQRETNTYERWLKQLDMELQFVPRSLFKNKEALYAQAAKHYPELTIIPQGGYPQPSSITFDRWLQEIPPSFTHYLIGCGTGATLLGLAEALQKNARPVTLIGISAIHMPEELERLQQEVQHFWPNSIVNGPPDGKRFGKISTQRLRLSKIFFEQCQLAPDPVYDASLLQWYVEAVQSRYFGANDRVLWLHSGGLSSWAGFRLECHELFGL